MRGTGIEKEVEIRATKITNQNQVHEHQYNEIGKSLWRYVVATTSVISGVKPEN
jgi:hypothetical protein